MSYKWKRCQVCGAEAELTDNVYHAEGSEHRIDGVRCPECDSGDPVEFWDSMQASARARKRFELVKAIATGQFQDFNSWADYNRDVPPMMKNVKDLADSMLNELYGPVPEEEK